MSPLLPLQSNAAKQYSDHVAEQVKIEWELEGARKCGVSSLKGMRLESSVLHHMQPDPLLIGQSKTLEMFNEIYLHSVCLDACRCDS